MQAQACSILVFPPKRPSEAPTLYDIIRVRSCLRPSHVGLLGVQRPAMHRRYREGRWSDHGPAFGPERRGYHGVLLRLSLWIEVRGRKKHPNCVDPERLAFAHPTEEAGRPARNLNQIRMASVSGRGCSWKMLSEVVRNIFAAKMWHVA